MSGEGSGEGVSGDGASEDSSRGDGSSGDDRTLRRRVLVGGRVQGVFFRDSLRREAQSRGVAGWVTNRADGQVEAVLEGPAPEVEALVAWMRHGPPHAEVESAHVTHEQPSGETGFQVR